MHTPDQLLEKLTQPKPHRKGASEEHIYVANQKARTNAALIAAVKGKQSLMSVKG